MRRQDAEGGTVLVKACRPRLGEFTQAATFFLGLSDRLVINIGNIADGTGRETAGLDNAPKEILHHEGAEVPDVGRPVFGRAAAIEPQGQTVQGLNWMNLTTEGVVE